MPALIERRKMTRATYQALKRHILRSREKKKQEQEADLALERQRKETERRKRLENENKNSLQQTKDELLRYEKQLEEHRKEKSELFSKLKRILENENTKKVNEKKHETQLQYMSTGQSQPPMHFLSGTGHMGRPVMFKPIHHGVPGGQSSNQVNLNAPSSSNQRKGSPSPTPNVFQFHPGGAQPSSMYGGGKFRAPTQDGGSYQPYSHHSAVGKHSHKSQKHGAQQQHNPSDNYQNKQPVNHMMPQSVPTPPRHPSNPPKGSIMTGSTSYGVHGNSHPSPGGPGNRGPGNGLPQGAHNMPQRGNPYPRDNRPSYYQGQ